MAKQARPEVLAKRLEEAWVQIEDHLEVTAECWSHESQYVVNVERDDQTYLRVEFCELDIIVSMHEQVRYDVLRPYLMALDMVAGFAAGRKKAVSK